MDFNFPVTEGAQLKRLLKNAPAELTDLLTHMLSYDPDERYNARQCLKHPYFRELREADRRSQQILSESSEAHPQIQVLVLEVFRILNNHNYNVVTLPGAVISQSFKQKQDQSQTDIHSLPPLCNAVSSENTSNQQSGSMNTNFMSSCTSSSSQLPSLNDTRSSFSGNQADKSGAQQSVICIIIEFYISTTHITSFNIVSIIN
ncbi:MAG: hypothetical protein EZS28_041066 [Streblomastix strix]|uniref:Protein kinase domain-containing protein n=1 Tax=Streblomastix strix TaxID=222440 RepID=A0A5J4TYR2_9EUKA|nr:MAG: hypothetical protein EZS28_041066 [Streblomastix strix]